MIILSLTSKTNPKKAMFVMGKLAFFLNLNPMADPFGWNSADP